MDGRLLVSSFPFSFCLANRYVFFRLPFLVGAHWCILKTIQTRTALPFPNYVPLGCLFLSYCTMAWRLRSLAQSVNVGRIPPLRAASFPLLSFLLSLLCACSLAGLNVCLVERGRCPAIRFPFLFVCSRAGDGRKKKRYTMSKAPPLRRMYQEGCLQGEKRQSFVDE